MLDVRRLVTLQHVARTGSISAAAAELHVTASAASQQLRALERDIGVRLLERSARSVRLTEAGRVLVEHAARVLAEIDAAERAAQAVADLRGGRLRLGSFASAASTLLPAVIAAFGRRHPQVEVTLTELEPEAALPALREGQLDLALAHSYTGLPAPQLRGLEHAELFVEPLLLAQHAPPRPSADPAVLTDFAGAKWISTLPVTGFQAITEHVCRAAGFEPLVLYRADDYAVMRALVAADLGVALIPQLASQPTEGVAYRPLREQPAAFRHVFAAWRHSDPSSAVTNMTTLLAEVTAARRGELVLAAGRGPAQTSRR